MAFFHNIFCWHPIGLLQLQLIPAMPDLLKYSLLLRIAERCEIGWNGTKIAAWHYIESMVPGTSMTQVVPR